MFNNFARHEQAFADWRRDGYPGVKAETDQYIDFLSDPAERGDEMGISSQRAF